MRERDAGAPLDDGDELHVLAADFLEEAVDFEGLFGGFAVEAGECVEADLAGLEGCDAAHDFVEGGGAFLVDAVGVVEVAGAVDADADEEVVLLEEVGPFGVEQGGVCLEGVFDGLAVGVLGLEGDGLAEEFDAEQGGLAALPCEADVGRGLGLDVLADVVFEQLGGHAPFAFGVEGFLFEVEAVLAVEVADGPDGLGHDVEGAGALVLHGRGV